MESKLAADGLEKLLEGRRVRRFPPQLMIHATGLSIRLSFSLCGLQRYIKPTQLRQRKKKTAAYNSARREREKIVEAALADPALTPF